MTHPHLGSCTPLDCPTFKVDPKERTPIFAAMTVTSISAQERRRRAEAARRKKPRGKR